MAAPTTKASNVWTERCQIKPLASRVRDWLEANTVPKAKSGGEGGDANDVTLIFGFNLVSGEVAIGSKCHRFF